MSGIAREWRRNEQGYCISRRAKPRSSPWAYRPGRTEDETRFPTGPAARPRGVHRYRRGRLGAGAAEREHLCHRPPDRGAGRGPHPQDLPRRDRRAPSLRVPAGLRAEGLGAGSGLFGRRDRPLPQGQGREEGDLRQGRGIPRRQWRDERQRAGVLRPRAQRNRGGLHRGVADLREMTGARGRPPRGT